MNNLKSINISNYKCFKRVSFNLKEISVLIGENNAGKSTAIEAIKLVAFGIERLKTGGFVICPDFVSSCRTDKCIKLNTEDLLIDLSVASSEYNGLPAYITAYFENKSRVIISIKDNMAYASAYDFTDKCLITKFAISKVDFPAIYVMPHFNLLRETEVPIDERRTKRDRFNYRSSLHFRNELRNFQDDLPKLNEMLNNTWQGLQISVNYNPVDDTYITTYVRDKSFSAEIKDYGSGLQMWLQILWFLCKINEEQCIVVLDEPDVYIHADLQRKLYHIVAERYSQIIIATHSIEIINETKLSNILIVDKSKSSFKFCKEKTTLDHALKTIGSTQNVMLTKLQRHNRCLFVEGLDLDILDELFKIANNSPSKSIKDFATGKLDGKDNYKEAFGIAKVMSDTDDFKTFCLLDKDYNQSYNEKIMREAEDNGVLLYVLERLEIENYLIIPRIIAEFVGVDVSVVEEKIKEIADTLKGDTFDRILQDKILEYRKLKENKSYAQISRETRQVVESNWNSLDNILSIVPGKELKGKIYEWIKRDYKKSCSDKKILSKVQISDIPIKLVDFLRAVNE